MTSAPPRQQDRSMPADTSQTEMILAQIESLPTLPSIAVRLLELTGSETSSAREVIRLVESDPSIAGRLLSLVNRANVGVSVNSIDRAVVLLGFDAVRCLVLSMQVFEMFSRRAGEAGGQLDLPGLWRHCLAVGCCMRLLAEEWSRTSGGPANGGVGAPAKPEEAFLCGLLHDLGKAALHVCFPKSYDRVVQAAEASQGSILDAERAVLGLDHTTAGRRLAAHWKLPPMIGECIWLHHHEPASTPTRIGFPRHVHLVQVADRLARQMHLGYSGNHVVEPPERIAAEIGFSIEALERARAALPDLIEERAELIGLARLTSREVYQGALTQANVELSRINSRLLVEQRLLEQRSRCLEAVSGLALTGPEEPTHEQVMKAAARGLSKLYPGSPAAVLTRSEARGLAFLAVAREGEAPICDARPISGEEIARQAGLGSGWADAAHLEGVWLDRLRAQLAAPPRWCWVIRENAAWRGAFCLAGGEGLEPDVSTGVDLLAVHTARWLSVAEACTQSRLLHEELADINRRLVAAQAQIAQMRSLAMVGEMAAGAAHELNNPLAVISGRAQLLDREGMSDEVRKNAILVSEHAHRASQMVSELMEFAKPPPPAPDALDLKALLARVRHRWIERGELAGEVFGLSVSDELPRVWADESQMLMLFDELIRNAIEAMAGSQAPRLLVNCQVHPTDEKVVVRIEDNGRGMTPEVLERAVTPFYSSRPAGRGRGLGLSRAVRYAEINGGRIRLVSRPGEGTQALVELPRAGSV